MLAAILSAFHVLALALGLPAIFLRTRALGRMPDPGAYPMLFAADNVWGLAAVMWLVTGLWRAFGGVEKGATFYLDSQMFWLKMGLFALVLVLEILPMLTLIRWRMLIRRRRVPDFGIAPTLRTISALEVVIVVAIPFVAALMARGFGQPARP
jgi:putative membrane protein